MTTDGARSPVTIVTGASRGIGAATARLLAARGHHVVVGFRSATADAGEVVTAIEAAGGTALAVGADIGDEDDVARLFGAARAGLGPVTGLVANAAASYITGTMLRVAGGR